MADIRQSTTIKDDFNRADENPVALPWAQTNTDAAAGPCKIASQYLRGTKTASDPSTAYWTLDSWSGNDAEVWATAMGDAPLTESYRIGLMTDVGLGSGAVDGYLCLPSNAVGPDVWALRKYTNGGFSTPAIPQHVLPDPNGVHRVLMRCNGGDVEVWMSEVADPDTWELIVSISDSTYRTNLYAVLGTTGTAPGWDDFGGGPLANPFRPQFYRRHHHTSR